MTLDDNDRLREGRLPSEPFADADRVTRAESEGTTVESHAWSAPTPLVVTPKVPTFPISCLPTRFGNWALAVAEALQCPIDLPAILVLGMLSVALAKRFLVRVRSDWDEPINIFALVALDPGESKSPAFRKAIQPIERFEVEEYKRLQPEIEIQTTYWEIASKRVEQIKARAAKADDASERGRLKEEAEQALKERAAITIPVAPQFIADDITSEKLVEVMRHQGGRIAVVSDEGGPFELMSGRYSEGMPNFEVYLKGHSGSLIKIDRIGRIGGTVRKPAVTVCLTVQREVVSGLGMKKGFRGRGLLARFLFVIPASIVGKRLPNPKSVPWQVQDAYDKAILALLRIPNPRDAEGEIVSVRIDLDSEAYSLLVRFKEALEPSLGSSGELESLADWGNKLAGTVIRIAALLHLADRADEEPSRLQDPVGPESVLRAIEIANYLQDHARVAFDMMSADPAVASARHVLRWIRRQGKPSFDRRHAYLGCRPHFTTPDDIDPALTLLVEHGVIRERPEVRRSVRGRSPSPMYDVNPAVIAQNSQNAQNSSHPGSAGHFENSENDSGARDQ